MTSAKTKPIQKALMECKGDNCNLILVPQGIIIERKGGFLSSHKKDKKAIPYTDIKDFHYLLSYENC